MTCRNCVSYGSDCQVAVLPFAGDGAGRCAVGLRETKMERTRRFIAESAFDLFVAQGYDDTTIEQIAAAAEVGTRTLYRYYSTKEALVVSFVENGLDAAMDAFLA